MATMSLYNKVTGATYGYFGTPYPTRDDAIMACFPEWDINQAASYNDSEHGEIWLDDVELGFNDEIKTINIIGKTKLADSQKLTFSEGFRWVPVYEKDGVQGLILDSPQGLRWHPLNEWTRNAEGIREKHTKYPELLTEEEKSAMPNFYTNMLADLPEVE